MTDSTSQDSATNADVLLAALSKLAGPAIVLDRELRVLAHTPGTERLVGTPVPAGVTAPKLLCGMGPERPLAEALAAGRPVTAHVERVSQGGGTTLLRVRATPVEHHGERAGWLLLLEGDHADHDTVLDVGGIVTRDAAMKHLLERAERAAESDAPVLIGGEHGTGKTRLARFIHEHSKRKDRPFHAVNCAVRPVAWLEGELFGRGGAPGQLGPAHGGTLFLDEVNALPVELQGRLIHVLEVGESKLDARLVSASPRPLRREVERERFNAELMYRLRVIPLFIPPLRDRSGDIELLARDFVAQHNQTSVRQVARISPGAVTALASYVWPGNVRELDNAIRYAFVMGDGPVLTEGDLPPEVRGEEQGRPLPANIPPDTGQLPSEARRILRALERAGGNRERAAASLGMSRVTLWRKLKAFELEDTVRAGRRTHRH